MKPLQEKNTFADWEEMFSVFLSRIWLIIFVGVLGALGGLAYTKKTAVPIYTSTTKIYVLERKDNSNVTTGDLALGAELATDYTELIKDRTVAEEVISELELSMSPEALASKISVSMKESSRIITIGISDRDPYTANKLVTAVREAAVVHIKQIMNSETINVVEEANIPQSYAPFSYKKNALMGAVAGILLVCAITYLQYVMSDTIKRPEDVTRYLGLSVLGSVPVMELEKGKVPKQEREESKGKSKAPRRAKGRKKKRQLDPAKVKHSEDQIKAKSSE